MSKMMFPVLFFFLCLTLGESLDKEESCSFSSGNQGVCTRLSNCQPVKQQLIIGNVPETLCRYTGLEPIVCCPPMSQSPVVPLPASHLMGDGRGAISSGDAKWVRVGDLSLVDSADDGVTPVDRRITQRIRHPQYKPPSAYHDIALLRLDSRVLFNPWIRPACLHTAPSTETPKTTAVGWGPAYSTDMESANDLTKIFLRVIDSKTCNTSWNSDRVNIKLSNGVVDDWMICADMNDTDTCQSDSGGPLVIRSKSEFHCMYDVVGVTSFEKSCGSALPGIYTRVYHYVPWIESVVWGQG